MRDQGGLTGFDCPAGAGKLLASSDAGSCASFFASTFVTDVGLFFARPALQRASQQAD